MRVKLLLLLLLTTVICAPVLAWNKPTHMMIGAITYSELKTAHPATLVKVIVLLRAHPEYAEWQSELVNVSAPERDRYLFMLASRWPDDIRKDPRYDHPEWHYIDLPITVDTTSAEAPASPNLLEAFAENEKILRKSTNATERAIALCWVLHLIGDGHCPLHAVSLFSPQFPRGDRGGNKFFVRTKDDGGVVNLHALWDGLLITTDKYQTICDRAILLCNQADLTRTKLTELRDTEFRNWVKHESYAIAKTIVYQNGKLRGGTRKEQAVTLPDTYLATAKTTAQRRVLLAGYRTAALLAKDVK